MIFVSLGSIVLGLIAWFLPIVSLAKHAKSESKNWIIFSMLSIGACATSLLLRIVYQNHLVNIEDWSAIMDTTRAEVILGSGLLAVTLLLNAIHIVKFMKKR
jgi:cytochrome c oxidase subunit 4